MRHVCKARRIIYIVWVSISYHLSATTLVASDIADRIRGKERDFVRPKITKTITTACDSKLARTVTHARDVSRITCSLTSSIVRNACCARDRTAEHEVGLAEWEHPNQSHLQQIGQSRFALHGTDVVSVSEVVVNETFLLRYYQIWDHWFGGLVLFGAFGQMRNGCNVMRLKLPRLDGFRSCFGFSSQYVWVSAVLKNSNLRSCFCCR